MPIMLKMSSKQYWNDIREIVRLGLGPQYLPVGSILYDNPDSSASSRRESQIVAYDKHFDPALTAQGYTHSMTLCQLKLSGMWQFDATEAFLYVEQEMEPATYRIRMPDGYDDANGGNGRSYLFTTTKTIPVGGQITLSWANNSNPTSVSTYSSSTSTTALDSSRTLTLWDESTEAVFIGTIKYDNNTDDSVFGKLNQIQRVRYGSNNYYQSGLRQILNTDSAANTWWQPTTLFDRPYNNRSSNGYLRSLNEDFVNILATPEITHIANNKFEYPSLDGRTFTLNTEYKINTDKVFLLSHTEVGLSATPNIGTVLDYYSTHNTNNDRIKYRIDNGNAYYWWLRTPYPTSANGFRGCSASGALSSDNANSSNGVAPAHIIQ